MSYDLCTGLYLEVRVSFIKCFISCITCSIDTHLSNKASTTQSPVILCFLIKLFPNRKLFGQQKRSVQDIQLTKAPEVAHRNDIPTHFCSCMHLHLVLFQIQLTDLPMSLAQSIYWNITNNHKGMKPYFKGIHFIHYIHICPAMR